MGQAKNKQRENFSTPLIDEWEADDCINFAIALARLTGWLLHVDWWVTDPTEDISENEMKPLRVYVADNRDGIFDVRGVKTIAEFNQSTIIRLAKKKGLGFGGVRTRFYTEAMLATLPLRSLPNEDKISKAVEVINSHPLYLNAIPSKPQSRIPAYDAARYTFGRCVAYAEAICELIGLQPVAIMGKRFAPLYEGTKRSADGYFHSIVVHPNGMGEDAWGIAPIEDIAGRFGAIEFEISANVHQEVVKNYNRTSSENYEAELKIARELVAQYRLDA
ncbi:hypothetical protein [Undibacterium sp. Di24W]|uniref:hypothetical protein n=1 Tax=Undibacterium sp. Di24W TaxID=3413033 RepID=UPI003BF07992